RARQEIRAAIERDGYDERRGVFVQSFGSAHLDAALLLLPSVNFVAYDDERMVRTTAAIARDLRTADGLVRRYRSDDGLPGDEGGCVACTFWLAECLARQRSHEEAQQVFTAACGAATDLGLYSEQYDSRRGGWLGNFPQGLSHYSHIRAALALERHADAID